MATRIVRIYPGEKDSNIIGFSRSAGVRPNNEQLRTFMDERGYTMQEVARHVGSVSGTHIEVHPPMDDTHIQAFAALCVRGLVEGSNENVAVIDNRNDVEIPGNGPVIAHG